MASLLLRGNAYGLIARLSTGSSIRPQVDMIAPDHGARRERQDGPVRKIFKIGQTRSSRRSGVASARTATSGRTRRHVADPYAARTIGIGLDAESSAATSSQRHQPDRDPRNRSASQLRSSRRDQAAREGLDGEPRHRRARRRHETEPVADDLPKIRSSSRRCPTQRDRGRADFRCAARDVGHRTPGGGVVTYANREQRAQDFLNNAINPWLARLEEALSAWFPRGTYVKFNTGALLRSAT
jgi:hypothetical protein